MRLPDQIRIWKYQLKNLRDDDVLSFYMLIKVYTWLTYIPITDNPYIISILNMEQRGFTLVILIIK